MGDGSAATSFIQRKRKSFKIKSLIGELPTIDKLSVRRPDLYKNWLCTSCNTVKEDYYHLWTCSHRSRDVLDLCSVTQDFLNKSIMDKLGKNDHRIDLYLVKKHHIMGFLDSSINLTACVQLAKGIIPTQMLILLKELFSPSCSKNLLVNTS